MCNYEAEASEQLSYSHIGHAQVLQSQTLFIIDVPRYVETKDGEASACYSVAHDIAVQQSDSQTGTMMNQNHTGNRGDSQTSENKKSILGMFGRAVSFPIMFILPFSLLAPGAFIQNLKRVDYWTRPLLLTVVAVAGNLVVQHGTLGRSWERRQVQKGLTWMPKHVHHRSDYPHQGQDRHEGSTMKK